MSKLVPVLLNVVGLPLNLLRDLYLKDSKPLGKAFVYVVVSSLLLGTSNLFDFSTPEELRSVKCSEADFAFRKADGSCNHREMTAMGMAGSRFGRNVRSSYETTTPPRSELFEPRPEVAGALLTGRPGAKQLEHDSLNLFFGTWIQFMTHDWFNHDTDEAGADYELRTRAGAAGGAAGTFKLKPTKRDDDGYMRTTVTHWWDMSQVYGSDQATQDQVRSHVDGKLAVGADGLIPKDAATGLPITGFNTNWWTGLEVLHNLFTLEHNYVCDELRKAQPKWDDERLFQTARLIVAAEAAVIHTQDWTTILLQNRGVMMGLHTNMRGIDYTRKLLRDDLSFADRALMWKLARLGVDGGDGIGDKTVLKGVPFSQTEDFVSVYRMHALLPEELTFGSETSSLLNNSFELGRAQVEEHGLEAAVKAFAAMKTTQVTTHNYPESLARLRMKDGNVLDMAAVDLFRDRERGVPRYNEFREKLGLDRAERFEDINANPEVVRELSSVYASVDDVDLQVGMAAEDPRPKGFAISETAFYIFLVQTSRRLQADRFYQEAFNEETYTAWGMRHAYDATLKGLIERHFPALAGEFPEESAFLRKQ